MVHLAALIRRSFFKVYAVLVLIFCVLAGGLSLYVGINQKQYTVSRSTDALLLAQEEASSVYIAFISGRSIPENPNPKFLAWTEYRPKLLAALPDMGITLDSIDKSGRLFYEGLRAKVSTNTNTGKPPLPTPPNPAAVEKQYNAFKNNINSLLTPLSNYTYRPSPAEARITGAVSLKKRLFFFFENALPFLVASACIFLIFTVLWASKGLAKKIRRKNDEILDLLWSVLKEQHSAPETQNLSPEFLQNHIYVLAGESRSLLQSLEELKQSVHQIPLIKPENAPLENNSEQITYIQKLLTRLFTRVERVAALAKASSGNGAQAGILALNISIEAARAGDAGRPFLAGAEKIKDFGEKTSRIGEAVLEEIKDADTAIRKAYATGKGLLEQPAPQVQNQASIVPDIEQALRRIEDTAALALRVQQTVRDIEQDMDEFTEAFKLYEPEEAEESLTAREAVLRSFEQLYILSRGDAPPTHILRNE